LIARATAATCRQTGSADGCGGETAKRTSLSPASLAEFKGILLARRRDLLEDISAMESEGGGDTLSLLGSEWDLLRQIDEALARIERGTYGICEGTGRRIKVARLRACPWAKYCIEYARKNERPRMRLHPGLRRAGDHACGWPEPDALQTRRRA
jgi:hypothetical protein